MAISGSPKKLAQDVADGYLLLTPPLLKAYSPADLKVILANLAFVARDLRQEPIPLDDVPALKMRNQRLSRLSQAEMVIRAWGKKQRLAL